MLIPMLNYHYDYLQVLDKHLNDVMLKEMVQQEYCWVLVRHCLMMNWNWHLELMNLWLYFHRLFVEIFLMLHDELEARRKKKKGVECHSICNHPTSFRCFTFLFSIFCSTVFKPNLNVWNDHSFSFFSNQSLEKTKTKQMSCLVNSRFLTPVVMQV